MPSSASYMSTGTQPLSWTLMTQTPQYRVNETAPALTQDVSIASSRALQDYQQRTVPDMANANAAQGDFGSSGFKDRMSRANIDFGRNQNDLSRMYNRNMASIARNKIMATMGVGTS